MFEGLELADADAVADGVVSSSADAVRDLRLPERAKPDSDRVTPDFAYVRRELGLPSVTQFCVGGRR